MRNGPKNFSGKPGVGDFEGFHVVIEKDGSARLYDDPNNPNQFRRIGHGMQLKGARSNEWHVWDAHQRQFVPAAELPSLTKAAPENERIRRLTAGQAMNTIGGRRFWVDEQNVAWVAVSDDPAQVVVDQVAHGDHVELTDASGAGRRVYWDANQKTFLEHSPLAEQLKKGRPDSFATDQERATAIDDLTTKMNDLLSGVSDDDFKRRLEAQVKGVKKPSEAEKLRKHFEELEPHMQMLRR